MADLEWDSGNEAAAEALEQVLQFIVFPPS